MTRFIGVDLGDIDTDQIAADALDYLTDNISGYVPQEGNLEVWLVEATARMHGTTRALAGNVPLAIFRYYGESLMGILPINGTQAIIATRWTAQDALGYTIPSGTQVAWPLSGDQLIPFITAADIIILPGQTTVDMTLTAVDIGVIANGLGPGTLTLLDPLAFVLSVQALSSSSGGADAESDDAYIERLIEELAVMTPTPVLPQDFAVLARRVAGVKRATGVDGYIPARTVVAATTSGSANLVATTNQFVPSDAGRSISGAGIPGGTTILSYQSGTTVIISANATATASAPTLTIAATTGAQRAVAVAAVDATGSALAQPVKDAIASYLESLREINFVVSAIDPTLTTINVTYDVTLAAGYSAVDVQAAIDAALTAYLSPATWGVDLDDEAGITWSNETILRYNEVITLVGTILGVRYVNDLTLNSTRANVTLAGQAPLPQLGTLSGTVT